MSDLPVYVLDLLSNIAKADGLTDYTVELTAGCKHGDNFLGVVQRAVLHGQRNGNAADLNLIIKLTSPNTARRQEFLMDHVFAREVLMYEKILPLFQKFQRDKGLAADEGFTSFPKCYAAIADEQSDRFVVIMEDLREKGFTMWPKEQPIPRDHLFMIVGQLAKLHAISFALKDQKPKVYEEFRELKDLFRCFFRSEGTIHFMDSAFDRAIGGLVNEQHIEWLSDFKANMHTLREECLADGACDPFGVIGHGDLWLNNILFRCCDKSASMDNVCFLDWQLTRFASPAMDLYHILLTSTDKELRDTEYRNLLHHYHRTLTMAIKKLGSDPDVFTRNDLDSQLKKSGPFGIIIATFMIQLMLADSKDISDLDELSECLRNNEKPDLVKEMDETTQLIYNKRIQDVVGDLFSLGLYAKRK